MKPVERLAVVVAIIYLELCNYSQLFGECFDELELSKHLLADKEESFGQVSSQCACQPSWRQAGLWGNC